MKSNKKTNSGFTLIEILVVFALIALLSSIALVAYQETRQKSRDAKRLSDMTQMMNGLELFQIHYKGYPAGTNGDPNDSDLSAYVITNPKSPMPADGDCATLTYPSPPVPAGIYANAYYYYPTNSYVISGKTVYGDYNYYFCLGNKTGNFSPGIHYINSQGIR